MTLHIACDSCTRLRTLEFKEGFVTSAGNRCCFCGVNIDGVSRGFEYGGNDITCQSDHISFQSVKDKSNREKSQDFTPEPKDTLITLKPVKKTK